jgi:hypothetical protein
VGPKRASPQSPGHQGAEKRPGRGWRLCLLKGCKKWFTPGHPLQRYCPDKCRREAERWRRWRAGLRYRATAKGKEKRRAQCRRSRQRRKKGTRPEPAREGHRKRGAGGIFSCDRPGCYELFQPRVNSRRVDFPACHNGRSAGVSLSTFLRNRCPPSSEMTVHLRAKSLSTIGRYPHSSRSSYPELLSAPCSTGRALSRPHAFPEPDTF